MVVNRYLIFSYMQRSCSTDSFIHYSPEEKPSSNQMNNSNSPSFSIDDMLDSAEEEYHRLPSAINPEPLWQLEFGSCWERMEESPITENPNDLVIDIEGCNSGKATGDQLECDIIKVVNNKIVYANRRRLTRCFIC